MRTPRLNSLLFTLYTLFSIVVFLAALVSPPVARIAPAPLRDWIGSGVAALAGSFRIPNIFAGKVTVEISSSNTKEDWMNAVTAQFNAEEHTLPSGEIIAVEVAHVTSLGASNPTTIRLAKRLVDLAPPGLAHVFFSDDGATAAVGDRTEGARCRVHSAVPASRTRRRSSVGIRHRWVYRSSRSRSDRAR